MWPGLNVPKLAPLPETGDQIPGEAELKDGKDAAPTQAMLRIPIRQQEMVLPASCLLEPGTASAWKRSAGNLKDLLELEAVATMPGNGMEVNQAISITGNRIDELEALAQQCEDLGLTPAFLSTPESTQVLAPMKESHKYVKVQKLTISEGSGPAMPYLKPKASMRAAEKRFRTPAANNGRQTNAQLNVATLQIGEKNETDRGVSAVGRATLLHHLNTVIAEAQATASMMHAMPLMRGSGMTGAVSSKQLAERTLPGSICELLQLGGQIYNAVKRSGETELPRARFIASEAPAELCLMHEQMAASAVNASQEQLNVVPGSHQTSTESREVPVNALALRIRGSTSSAYPIVKQALLPQHGLRSGAMLGKGYSKGYGLVEESEIQE
mmetsp:Transcript_15427/g.27012  ORF Transcript_15427/g.27012 Transcript_15427/m.27012 type:complete len:384 (+) Transcript_15427:297-1448(+)